MHATWDSVGTAVWGVLHTFAYSVEDARRGTLQQRLDAYVDLVNSIKRLYPCFECYTNMNGIHEALMADCCALCAHASRTGCGAREAANSLAMWAFRLHNAVTRWKCVHTGDPLSADNEEWIRLEDVDSGYASKNVVACRLRERWYPR